VKVGEASRSRPSRTRWALYVGAAVVVVVVVVLIVLIRPNAAPGSGVAVLSTKSYGAVLVVKSGELAGFPLYEFSGDVDGRLGCGTTKARGYDLDPNGATEMTCTGPMSDILHNVTSDDWPAFTTKGSPIAGAGVDQKLLGTRYRRGIGNQVTYAGHPLYLFDPSSSPFTPLGERYVETVSPLAPWRGFWTLVSANNGNPDEGDATIETGMLANGHRVLAVEGDPNINPLAVTTYTYSAGLCGSSCAPEWLPVLTTGRPLVRDLPARAIGEMRLANGAEQVTYYGKPLYEYWKEKVTLAKDGSLAAAGTAGNGNGLSGPAGTFSTVPIGS
jgi:predicted lipoprotein with Yx(FWY)xxD motif